MDKKICKRCHLLFTPEDWDDDMCRECRGELQLIAYEEAMNEGLG